MMFLSIWNRENCMRFREQANAPLGFIPIERLESTVPTGEAIPNHRTSLQRTVVPRIFYWYAHCCTELKWTIVVSVMTSHFADTEQKLRKNAGRSASSDGFGKQAEIMRTWRGRRGRSFQVRAAATGKARSPTVDSRVWQTGSDVVNADGRRVLIPRSAGVHL